jgi:hypothetical protein
MYLDSENETYQASTHMTLGSRGNYKVGLACMLDLENGTYRAAQYML